MLILNKKNTVDKLRISIIDVKRGVSLKKNINIMLAKIKIYKKLKIN